MKASETGSTCRRSRRGSHLASAMGARRRPSCWPFPPSCLAIAGAYYYVSFARVIDARLHGERDRVLPRVFARPLELRRGQSLTERQLVDRLNDLGYAQRAARRQAWRVRRGGRLVAIMPRVPELKGQIVRVVFQTPSRGRRSAPRRQAPRRRQSRRSRRGSSSAASRPRPRHARRAGADLAHQRRARETAAGGAVGDSAARGGGGALDRGSTLL